MKKLKVLALVAFSVYSSFAGQGFFEENWQLKTFVAPQSTIADNIPSQSADVQVTVNAQDTVNKVLSSVFSNNMNAWTGKRLDNSNKVWEDPETVRHFSNLSHETMRIPGGNWSNIWLWDGTIHWQLKDNYAADINSLPTTTWSMTTEELLEFCRVVGSEPQICVNYSLARYIDEPDPVAKAAHYAAEWVRDVNIKRGLGVRYWEVGNENYGRWQAGYDVAGDTITADEYGRDFCVFADSMKAADPTIKIGAVIFPFRTGTNVENWTQDVVAQVQNHADYLIVHEYFTWAPDYNSITAQEVLDAKVLIAEGLGEVNQMVQENTDKPSGYFPLAMTEYNMRAGDKNTTHVCGLFVAEALGEFIKHGFGLVNIWDALNSKGFEDHGLLTRREEGAEDCIPHPSFFPYYYYKMYFGDVMVDATSDNQDVYVYASRFSSGHVGMVVVNESAQEKTVEFSVNGFEPGGKLYRYEIAADSLTTRVFTINGEGPPEGKIYGPRNYEEIAPYASEISNGAVRISAKKYSVNYMVVEPETTTDVHKGLSMSASAPGIFKTGRNSITFSLSDAQPVTIELFNMNGKCVYSETIRNITTGMHTHYFSSSLPSGFYACRLRTPLGVSSKEIVLNQ